MTARAALLLALAPFACGGDVGALQRNDSRARVRTGCECDSVRDGGAPC